MSTSRPPRIRRSREAAGLRRRDPDLLTITQAAKFLKIRPATIKRWLAQGLPTERVGPRAVRLRCSTLIALLTNGLAVPTASPPALPASWRLLWGGRDERAPRP